MRVHFKHLCFKSFFGSMKCDSCVSHLAHTFTNPCLSREPKAKVVTSTISRRILQPPNSPIEINGKQEYEMREIIDFRISNCQFHYFIHLQGYDIIEQTICKLIWHLSNALEKVGKNHYWYINKLKAIPHGTWH
jgi:hypothetical protein